MVVPRSGAEPLAPTPLGDDPSPGWAVRPGILAEGELALEVVVQAARQKSARGNSQFAGCDRQWSRRDTVGFNIR